MALVRRHGDRYRPGSQGTSANELIVTGGHVGTHIDAIGHVGLDGCLYGGIDAAEATRGGRFKSLGVDEIKPMFTRGILLDVAAMKGVDHLPAAYGITPEDLDRALGNTQINKGDIALIRTGWLQKYYEPGTLLGDETGVPGVTGPAAEWLVSKGVIAAGTDTVAFDQILTGERKFQRPAHGILILKNGIHIIELLDLEELGAAKVKEFLFILAPLKLIGATGSPIRPLAIVDA